MGKKAKLGKRRKDRFYHLAKETGYRARSAFKLIQLNRKYPFLQQSRVLVDLCAAPGGWLQVAANSMPISSVIIGVDLVPIRPIKNVITLQEDITTEKCRQALNKELKNWKVDCFLNDGAPNVGSSWAQDAYTQSTLTLSALKLATQFLRPDGWFVTKVFRSKDYQSLVWVFKQLFKKVYCTKPQASRMESAEIFVVCQGYLAPDKIDPKLLDPKHVFSEIEEGGKQRQSFQSLQSTKKKVAEGYEEGSTTLYKEISLADFVLSADPIGLLGSVHSLKCTKESSMFLKHPFTTDEVKNCFEDIKVLGKREIRLILKWREKMKEFLREAEKLEQFAAGNKHEADQSEKEEEEEEDMDERIEELRRTELSDSKRKVKLLRKHLKKTRERLAMKLQAADASGPMLDEDTELFKLKAIKNQKHLEKVEELSHDSAVSSDDQSEDSNEDNVSDTEDEEQSISNSDEEQEEENLEEDEGDPDKEDGGLNMEDTLNEGSDDDENPLVYQFPEEKEAASRKMQTERWFNKDVFADLTTEMDEDQEVEHMLSVYKKNTVPLQTTSRTDEKDSLSPTSPKRKEDEDVSDSASDQSDDSESSDQSDYSNLRREMKNDTANDSMEIVPQRKKIKKLTPEGLAMGSLLVSSKKKKEELIDSSFNRWTSNDANLPDWFVEDEAKHCKKQIPITKDMVQEYRKKLTEINARPIKKVVEAKARKKKKLLKRMLKARKKAESISDSVDVSEKEKLQQLRAIYKKAGIAKRKKSVQYVVAKKGAGKRVPRPQGVTGHYKVVDPRMKKETRAKKRKDKSKSKHGKKRRKS